MLTQPLRASRMGAPKTPAADSCSRSSSTSGGGRRGIGPNGSETRYLLEYLYPEECPEAAAVAAAAAATEAAKRGGFTKTEPSPNICRVRTLNQASIWSTSSTRYSSVEAAKSTTEASNNAGSSQHVGEVAASGEGASNSSSKDGIQPAAVLRRHQKQQKQMLLFRGGRCNWIDETPAKFFLSFPPDSQLSVQLPHDCLSVVGSVLPLLFPSVSSLTMSGNSAAAAAAAATKATSGPQQRLPQQQQVPIRLLQSNIRVLPGDGSLSNSTNCGDTLWISECSWLFQQQPSSSGSRESDNSSIPFWQLVRGSVIQHQHQQLPPEVVDTMRLLLLLPPHMQRQIPRLLLQLAVCLRALLQQSSAVEAELLLRQQQHSKQQQQPSRSTSSSNSKWLCAAMLMNREDLFPHNPWKRQQPQQGFTLGSLGMQFCCCLLPGGTKRGKGCGSSSCCCSFCYLDNCPVGYEAESDTQETPCISTATAAAIAVQGKSPEVNDNTVSAAAAAKEAAAAAKARESMSGTSERATDEASIMNVEEQGDAVASTGQPPAVNASVLQSAEAGDNEDDWELDNALEDALNSVAADAAAADAAEADAGAETAANDVDDVAFFALPDSPEPPAPAAAPAAATPVTPATATEADSAQKEAYGHTKRRSAGQLQQQGQPSVQHAAGDLDQEFEFDDADVDDPHASGAAAGRHPEQQPQQHLQSMRSHLGTSGEGPAAAREAMQAAASGGTTVSRASSGVAAADEGTEAGTAVAAAANAESAFVQSVLWGELPGSSSFMFAQSFAALAWRESDTATTSMIPGLLAGDGEAGQQGKAHEQERRRERAAAAAVAAAAVHAAEEAAASRRDLLTELERSTSVAVHHRTGLQHMPQHQQQQQQISLQFGETQALLHRQQSVRFLLLLLATPPVSRIGAAAPPLSFYAGRAQQQQEPQSQLQQLQVADVAHWRGRSSALQDEKSSDRTKEHAIFDSSSSIAAIRSDSNSSRLVFQWGSVWAARRQQQRLLQRRQRLLSCFFLDLNDSSAAMAASMELGAEEGEELAGTPLGAAGGGAGVSKGVGASSGLGSDTAAGVATVAVAESGGAAAGPSRAQLQKMRRRAKQEVLKIDKQRRIELVKQGKSAYELRALAAAEELSREYRMRTPLQEFLLTAAEFGGGRHAELLQQLNVSFDLDFEKRQIHQREQGQTARGGAPLLHVKAALQLYGASPVAGRRARVAMLRFHRPDLRSSFASASNRKRGAAAAERPWVVLPPLSSEVLRRSPEGSTYISAEDYEGAPSSSGGGHPGGGGGGGPHPSFCFYAPKDLSLSDDCPFVLLEHTEQQPVIINNPGMALRITRYVRPLQQQHQQQTAASSANPSNQQDRIRAEEERLQGSMGTFGGLRLVEQNEKAPSLFGIDVPLEPGEGQAVVDCPLFSALVFPHPQHPQQPLGPEGRFNDPRRGDFLLIRRKVKEGWKSKKLLDERKLQSKAWALRYVNDTGITEMKRVKECIKARFCPPVIEKEVAQLLKQLSPIAPHRLPMLPEASIISIISPETVCSLETAHAAWYRLRAVGIVSLTSPEGLSSACAYVEAEERQQQQAALTARRRLRQLQQQQQQRREALGILSDGAAAAAAAEQKQLQQLLLQLSNSCAGRRYSPLIRFIEELLLSVPWQTTKECKEVLQNKGSAQFLLTGFGDPSCGRGEGVALLKRGSRSRSSNSSNPLAVQQQLRRHAAGGIAGTVDDLRKLGMMELRARLLQYGLSDAVIRTLPRWDQVALVRQYRDGFGAEDGGSKGRGAGVRLPAEEYEAKLSSILRKQQAALRADEPNVTDTDDDMQPVTPQQQPQQQVNAGTVEAAAVGTGAAAGSAAAAAAAGQKHGTAGEDVADALFAGCEESDHEQADETELEMRELQVLRDRQEARSQRPMTEEEQLRAEATVRAVPCLRWTRKRRQQVGDTFAADRCILIYGAENIKAFLAWRDQRLAKKRQRQMSAVHSKEALAGKRICRACGRPGHIASNVNCPLYRGPKRLGSTLGEMVGKRKKRRTADSDIDLSVAAELGMEGSLCSSSTRRGRGAAAAASAVAGGAGAYSSDSSEGEGEEEEGFAASGGAAADGDSFDSADGDELYSDNDLELNRHPKSALSRSSRSLSGRRRGNSRRQAAAERAAAAAAAQHPIDALNVSFARVVNLLLQQQTFKPFVSRVDDRVAPGYSTVVKRPMFLRRILSKCRERQYHSLSSFKEDIDLIVSNCFLFNPPGSPSAWLRDRALQLQQLAMQRLADQPEIAEYEAAIAQSSYPVLQQQQPQYQQYPYQRRQQYQQQQYQQQQLQGFGMDEE
ncbi:bromodomain-containing protein, putative [Eimeria tenella]|uniref:Bromodomain-containing protein, putative n=1 Tax=Eimeria tenella TaxID=5802 RepID=U6KLE2_EIMTE|nr:bromodomain-containing protein, putative [Eimeria tenella]CDJ37092.1 bromodomain-containing protein, putative [Eimeria tenella]|eukprot:XP_013227930.1 bromodomain-containing protein, putative [Eimeria tenella]